MNIWRVLGLEPTRDLSAIRRAYAAAARKYHPEEQPEEFQRVRAAYEQALLYARSAPRESNLSGEASPAPADRYKNIENKSAPKKGVATGGTYIGPTYRRAASGASERRRPQMEARVERLDGGDQWEPDWLREETTEGQAALFSQDPAMTAFRELWRQEKKRGEKKEWREYFSSPAFLAVQREGGFTAALLGFVEGEVKNGQPLPQRFLLELAIAYGIRYNGKTPFYLSCAAFPGIDPIRDLLLLGHPLDRLSHEEDKIWAACWRDYFELLSLVKSGGFENADRTSRWKELLHRYRRENITDRPEVTRKREEEVERRHSYGLRLLAALVKNHPLPAETLQYLYDDLQLEAMASGSSKRDYKPLLDALLPVLPDQRQVKEERELIRIVKKAVENFLQKYDRRVSFPHTDVLRSYETEPSDEEKEAARMLVESASFQGLLTSRRLEESGLLEKIFSAPTALTTALAHQLEDRADDPVTKAVAARYLESSCKWLRDPELFFDRPYPFVEMGADPEAISLDNWEFWHYYFSTAFPAAFSTDKEEFIGKIIEEVYHPSLWWRRVFTGFDETAQRILRPRIRLFSLGEYRIKMEFHFFYQVFWVNGEETAGKFPWGELLSLAGEDDLLFWLCLPLATGRDEERPAIRREVTARLRRLDGIYATNAGRLADCLVNHIIAVRGEDSVAAGRYQEDGHALYGWRLLEDRRLEVYRVTGILRRRERLWDRRFTSAEIARVAAEQQLTELLSPLLRLLERRRVAGLARLEKAAALADCLGEGLYTWEDRQKDEENKPALAIDDFLDYGAKHHGSYTADFYRRYLRHPYRAGVRFGSQEGERFFLEFFLEIWPYGSEKGRREPRKEMLTQLGMLGEPVYFVGCIRMGDTGYTLIANSYRRTLFAVREGTSNYHSGGDLAALLGGMLTRDEWEAVEFVERYEGTGAAGREK